MILNDIKCRICVFQSKQANNYFFHFSYVGNRIFSPRFFELFEEWMETHLFGRALTRSQMDFVFYTFSTFGMRSWRNARHQLYQSRKSSAEWRAETDLFIDVIVIELYVIKIWWIIKLNNRRIYQLVFPFQPVLKNLNKLYLLVTKLFFRN